MRLKKYPWPGCLTNVKEANCSLNWRKANVRIKKDVLEGFSRSGQRAEPQKYYCIAMNLNYTVKPRKMTLTAKPCITKYRAICQKS